MYEDIMNLIARLSIVAASYVYRRNYKDAKIIPFDDSLDYGANYAHVLGFDDSAKHLHEFMRLYISIVRKSWSMLALQYRESQRHFIIQLVLEKLEFLAFHYNPSVVFCLLNHDSRLRGLVQ